MSFSSRFWEVDFISQTGFDTLVTRMKEGRQTCRDIEEFLKQRAKVEEDYAKALLKVARVDRGLGETGTLKTSIDTLRNEAEVEASLHLTHSQQLQAEANKLAEFREKQREERRRHEETMHKSHKAKTDCYRRSQNCRNSYESKFRAAEKADSDAERLKFGPKQKEIEKARKNAAQSRQAAVKADDEYKSSVDQLEIVRQSWEQDHRNICQVFQRLEEERMQYLRNELWVFSNLGSDLFVKSDDTREALRVSLEKCDVDADIFDFVTSKSTGTQPLSPIVYTPCGGSSLSPAVVNNTHSNLNARSNVQDDVSAYASIGALGNVHKMYKAIYPYDPRTPDEIALETGDRVIVMEDLKDGWMNGKNTRTGQQGLFPGNYIED